MKFSLLSILFIGIFSADLRAQEKLDSAVDKIISGDEAKKDYKQVEQIESESREYIEVEPKLVYPSDVRGVYYLVPYKYRRPSWGKMFSLGFSTYSPKNYEPDFAAVTFDAAYGTADLPLATISFSVKKNFIFGSIGVEGSAGYYKNTSRSSVDIAGVPTALNTTLSIYPLTIGGIIILDNLFYEPIVAPYVSGGVYSMFYQETRDTGSVTGNTQISPYYSVGAQFQLDWLDRAAAREAYEEGGVESTYIYLEARGFIQSNIAQDPNFGSTLHANAGLRMEF